MFKKAGTVVTRATKIRKDFWENRMTCGTPNDVFEISTATLPEY